MRRSQSIRLSLLILFILLTVIGCSPQENKEEQGSLKAGQDSVQAVTKDIKMVQPETNQAVSEQTTEQISKLFIEMLENDPVHRSGALSPDKRYYAYEERSSIILVQLPSAQEYLADKTLVPKVLFTDGIRKDTPFAELESDYGKRLKQPLLTEEELGKAKSELRSVYKWDIFYYLTFSRDGRYLGYLREQSFGSNRTCTIYVLDLQDNCKLYSLPVKENSEHVQINWQADNQTLEIYLPHAAVREGESLALRRMWHLPLGQNKLAYYLKDGTPDREEIPLADARKILIEYAQAEAEQNRAEEKWNKLTVEELVVALTPSELAEEYKKYFSLRQAQIKLLKERGYSDETITKMDSYDFQQEEKGWLLNEEVIRSLKNLHPELKEKDLSQWTYKNLEDYDRPITEDRYAPSAALKQEMLERGLPQDIDWRVAKEFHGWENMLAYTNEAIMAMYEARQETEALFRKAEAYRLAVREAYLRR
ncbi:MAG: hypothetical protein ACOYVD_01940 [Bacillota bacterium]